MLSQVCKISSLARVIQAPAPTTKLAFAACRHLSTSLSDAQPSSIEKATLDLLNETVQRDKVRPVSDAIQRYQKIYHEGDLYHPEDLNDKRYRESLRQRRGKRTPPAEDPFEVLGLDPLHEYKNFRLLTHFVSDMGKILPRDQTGVSAKNQRKLAKAIKRARAMGLMSSTSKQYDFRV